MDVCYKKEVFLLIIISSFLMAEATSSVVSNSYRRHNASHSVLISLSENDVAEIAPNENIKYSRKIRVGKHIIETQSAPRTFKIDYKMDMFVMDGKPFR